jgi:hypothetical protein
MLKFFEVTIVSEPLKLDVVPFSVVPQEVIDLVQLNVSVELHQGQNS